MSGRASSNITQGFVQTHGLGICRGSYAGPLIKEWHRWDSVHESENDPVDIFPPDQLYVVFVVADGGADLERFELRSFQEAQSILMQVRGHLFCNLLHLTMPSLGCGSRSRSCLSTRLYDLTITKLLSVNYQNVLTSTNLSCADISSSQPDIQSKWCLRLRWRFADSIEPGSSRGILPV